MTTVEVLRKARALYAANPSHCREFSYPEAGTYCPVTVCARITLLDGCGQAVDALRTAIGTPQLCRFNAEHSTAEVLAAFDKAIEASA